jgi:hypothetical protein
MKQLELPVPAMPEPKHEMPFGPPATPEAEPAPVAKKTPAKPKG